MSMPPKIHQFLFPSLTLAFFIRLVVVSFVAYLIFGHLCLPLRLQGASMEPTYHDGSVNFCWRLAYLVSEPKRYDVVLVRFAGSKVMLLKRVVALEGEEVGFQQGKLFVNGHELEEPYVKNVGNWNLPPRKVEQGNVYLVGDNRSMPIEQHDFGQTARSRIQGTPLW